MENIEKLIALETSKARVYSLLAELYRVPESNLSAKLDKLESALAALDSDAREHAVHLGLIYRTIPDLSDLKKEYTRIFLGPFQAPAPPYGSIYLEKTPQLMGESTMDVLQHYLSLGLDLSPDISDVPDHIAVELEFMHVLICRGIEAVNDVDPGLFSENIRHRRTFLGNHLGAWVNAFTERIIQHAKDDYFGRLALLTRTFIREDMETLSDLPVEPVVAE